MCKRRANYKGLENYYNLVLLWARPLGAFSLDSRIDYCDPVISYSRGFRDYYYYLVKGVEQMSGTSRASLGITYSKEEEEDQC